MEILIISGMSGAGKSRAAICLEDSGYYIVDNLPAEMMVKFAEFCAAAGGRVVVGYATGLIDEHFHTWLGGYPGAGDGLLRSMLGVCGEEFNILGAEAEGEPGEIPLSSADD